MHEHPLQDQMVSYRPFSHRGATAKPRHLEQSVKAPITMRIAAHNENYHWTKVPGTEIMGQLCFFAGACWSLSRLGQRRVETRYLQAP